MFGDIHTNIRVQHIEPADIALQGGDAQFDIFYKATSSTMRVPRHLREEARMITRPFSFTRMRVFNSMPIRYDYLSCVLLMLS